MSTSKNTHPAVVLFERLFKEAEASDPIVHPSHFVELSIFWDRCKKAGIECPDDFINFCEWETEVGVQATAQRLVRGYYRRTGTKPPCDMAAHARGWKRMQRLGLVA